MHRLAKTVLTSFVLFGAPCFLLAQNPQANTLDSTQRTTLAVSISGLRNDKGQILVELWNSPDGFPTNGDKGFKLVTVDGSKAVGGTIAVTFSVPPGTYAVSTLHDENRNNKMNIGALGIPKEGYGASNNVAPHFRSPSFEEAKFIVPASGQKISICMRYLIGTHSHC